MLQGSVLLEKDNFPVLLSHHSRPTILYFRNLTGQTEPSWKANGGLLPEIGSGEWRKARVLTRGTAGGIIGLDILSSTLSGVLISCSLSR